MNNYIKTIIILIWVSILFYIALYWDYHITKTKLDEYWWNLPEDTFQIVKVEPTET